MKKLLTALFTLATSLSMAQTGIDIIPKPAEISIQEGYFVPGKSTIIIASPAAGHDADMLNFYMKKLYGLTFPVKNAASGPGKKNVIILTVNPAAGVKKDGYHLEVTKDKINITAANGEGLFYGIQTLLQLVTADTDVSGNIPPHAIPDVSVNDYPRFQYRGMHLDVGRHFFDAEQVKKYIDYLAYHKFNTFHWHLTEDQGWRIEIKKYPRLTSIGAWRNGTVIGHYPGTGNDSLRYGGFYTQKEVKEIVKYAADRYITIIPEIEMPGHSSAAIAAYPQLSCFPDEPTAVKSNTPWAGPRTGKQVQQTWGVFPDVYCPSEYTFKFIENVLDEVMELFPSKYIHIGGDECPKEYWKRSAFCQKLIKEKHLKNEEGLQSYFIGRIEKYLNSKGRSIIGWDEILEGGLAPNATVMSWRGESGGIAAAKQHHQVIMTPGQYCYFDHAQTKNEDSVTIGGYLPVDTVYSYEPVPKKLDSSEAKYVLGAQGNVWTEYIGNESKLEYMIFPRMSALSEVLWTPKEERDLNDFKQRLTYMAKRYQAWGANYFRDK
ncbi:MAG TPA: beta-N-acetylhexosaminidase [Chitinophagaceae bacterium]|nr:beta-N-acetylhexosaminidase [Chitinophagaceae bacterium]